MSGSTPTAPLSPRADRRDEPKAHPRTMLVLAVIATVLAISSVPPKPASGGTHADALVSSPAVLASAERGAWLMPLRDRLRVLGGVVSVGSQAVRAQQALVERVASVSNRLVGWLDGFVVSGGAARYAPAVGRSDQIGQGAWLEYLAAYSIDDEAADVTGSADPFGSGYGCPDGMVDGDDLLYRIAELAQDF